MTGLTEFQTGLIRVICGHILVKFPNLKDNHLTSVKQKAEDIHKGKKIRLALDFHLCHGKMTVDQYLQKRERTPTQESSIQFSKYFPSIEAKGEEAKGEGSRIPKDSETITPRSSSEEMT